MATIEKRGRLWRVKIRRAGHPAQTRTFSNRTQAPMNSLLELVANHLAEARQ